MPVTIIILASIGTISNNTFTSKLNYPFLFNTYNGLRILNTLNDLKEEIVELPITQ